MIAAVLPLDDPAADLATVGGKGASLARLTRTGLPVPPGFHVTTAAYRTFADGLRDEIDTAFAQATPERAADTIATAFARRPVPAAVAAAIRRALPDGPVAVRSSATAEDQPGASFAGQHDTFLNVTGADAVLDAVRRCWASLWTARAIEYRARTGATSDAIAVVVQELVPADAAGVLFTANPLTGARDELVVNATWGLGEALVGGHVIPDTYVLRRGGGELRREVNDKTVRTVRVDGGTREEPVPAALRRAPVLDPARTGELARLGERVAALYGIPMDVEWTLHNGRFAIVQARPVTGLPEVWNDSLAGDYLWTAGNMGEAIPSVMTPVTWSLVKALTPPPLGGHRISGNIGGRFYLNLSAASAAADALGLGAKMRQANEKLLGRLPAGVEVPPLPMSRPAVLRESLRIAWPVLRDTATLRRTLPELAATNPGNCATLRERIADTTTREALHALWRSDVEPLLREVDPVFEAGARTAGAGRLEARLRALVGAEDARTLLTGMHGAGGELASLGPVLGLARLRRGEYDRETFASEWGHRGADEFEVFAPRPAEEPGWLDRLLAAPAGTDPDELLARQAAARADAWRRLVERHPRKANRVRRALDRAAARGRAREQARSEWVRTFWVFRAYLLRAGELTGHGEDLFFVSIEEVATVLAGDDTPLAAVPARRAAYARYRALPPLPAVIRGRFDPQAWAADPDRRTDLYDETASTAAADDNNDHADLTGFPGAAGVVTGTARVVSTVEEGDALRPGEILVTAVTNVGWTPLFPRAAAVVTDVGAPLSHAAIVARELGIPAVVGCGTATTRIATGDRLLVDGARGTVTVL
ncbi:MAG TPA: PEP/pyruvate-binding domain-containing protein [Actinophytocola sp.]|nr:PEP/pyruvate-binding domain-containing protein [Actinophytocola sp.]